MNRISRLEQELDAQNAKKRIETTAYQPELKEMMKGLRGLDSKVVELSERVEEAEERLFGTERLGMEIEGRLNELEVKSEELEEEIDALKDGFDEDDNEEEETHRAKQEEKNHRQEPKELESRVVEILDEPTEQPAPRTKTVKTEPLEVEHQDDNKINTTTTIATVILAQPPFLKTFSLKRRLSDSNLLEDRQPHPAKKSRGLSDSSLL